jgi:uncharacterized protein YuzE
MAADMTYDPEADALTISFGDTGAVEGEEVHRGVILHFDAADRIVEIEVLHASKHLTEGAIALLQQAAGSTPRACTRNGG